MKRTELFRFEKRKIDPCHIALKVFHYIDRQSKKHRMSHWKRLRHFKKKCIPKSKRNNLLEWTRFCKTKASAGSFVLCAAHVPTNASTADMEQNAMTYAPKSAA